jgi:hypothetical protein
MQYQVEPLSSKRAGYPHSFFILNLIIVHLFASYTMLEIGYGKQVVFIPFVSMLVLTFLWWQAKQIRVNGNDWFVAAHWMIMTKRIRILLYFYIVGLVLGGFTYLMVGMSPLKGGDVTTIALRMGAVPVFLGVLVTFVLSGGSIFDAQRGMVGQKIVDAFPPPTDLPVISTAEGAGDDKAVTTPQDHRPT